MYYKKLKYSFFLLTNIIIKSIIKNVACPVSSAGRAFDF